MDARRTPGKRRLINGFEWGKTPKLGDEITVDIDDTRSTVPRVGDKVVVIGTTKVVRLIEHAGPGPRRYRARVVSGYRYDGSATLPGSEHARSAR